MTRDPFVQHTRVGAAVNDEIPPQNYGTEWLSCPSITARWLHGRIALFG